MNDKRITNGPAGEPDEFTWRLKANLFRWDCPPAEQLGDYYLGLLPAAENSRIEKHLETCLLCREDFETLTEFLKPDAPITQIKPIRGTQPQTYYLAYAPPPAGQIPLGVRGDTGSARRFTFAAAGEEEQLVLYLGLREAAGAYLLNGQFEMDEQTQKIVMEARVEIVTEEKTIITAAVDELGTFLYTLENDRPFIMRITTLNGDVLFGRVDLRDTP